MLWYIVKLVVLLPLIGGMIWGSLRLSRAMQQKLGAPQGGRSVRVVETMMLSPTIRLAVLEFHGREILVSTSRTGLARLAEAPARGDDHGPDGGAPRRENKIAPANSDGHDHKSDDETADDGDAWLARSRVIPADETPISLRSGSPRTETFTQTLKRLK